MPDGPPLSGREASRYLAKLADGVEEGYAAFYSQPGPNLIAVFALRFARAASTADRPARSRVPATNRVEIGPLVVIFSGDDGACYEAVEAYLRAVGK